MLDVFGMALEAIAGFDSLAMDGLGYVEPQSISEALRLLLFRSGLTVEELAAQSSVSRSSVSAHLGGERKLSVSVLSSLGAVFARALGYDAGILMGDLMKLAERERLRDESLGNAPAWFSQELSKAIGVLGLPAKWEDCDHESSEDTRCLCISLDRDTLLAAQRPYVREIGRLREHFGLHMEVETDEGQGLMFSLHETGVVVTEPQEDVEEEVAQTA